MGTSLSEIRVLETRLHSHFFEWVDPLNTQGELMWVLDELQEIHNWLDRYDVPRTHGDGIEANLIDRVKWITLTIKSPSVRK